MPDTRVAVVTGASSGIGAATARALAQSGFEVALGARRGDRIEALAAELGGHARELDVTDAGSVEDFAAWTEGLGGAAVLVNNAGGAKGLEPIAEIDEERWRWMYEVNVLGLAMVTKALLPQVRRSGNGHVVIIGSAAGTETYARGAGYTAAKFGTHAVFGSLRLELLGEDVRVTEVMPGRCAPSSASCALRATRRRPRHRTAGSHRSPQKTSPSACAGPSPCPRTSTWTAST